ncbi:MAG: ATP-binding protein [Acidobacteriota bacterium]
MTERKDSPQLDNTKLATSRSLTSMVRRNARQQIFSALRANLRDRSSLTTILTILIDTFQCDRALICALGEDGYITIDAEACRPNVGARLTDMVIPSVILPSMLLAQLHKQQIPLTISAVSVPRLSKELAEWFTASHTASALVYTIAAREDQQWLLVLCQSFYPRQWKRGEKSFFKETAEYLLIALEATRSYAELIESQRRYREMFEHALNGIYQSTPDGRFLAVNPVLAETLGYKDAAELLSIDIAEDLYVEGADREPLKRLLETQGYVKGHEQRLRRKDGRILIMMEYARAVRDSQGNVLYYEGTLEDITEKKLLEQQLQQSQKMDSIGRLAGGIAHDFNNLLAGILGYTSMLKQGCEPSEPCYKPISMVEELSKRAAQLTAHLLSFSRSGLSQVAPLNINRIVHEIVSLLEHTLDKRIQIEVECNETLANIEADSGQLHQALLNICLNARDAMPQGGQLLLVTGEVLLDEEFVRLHMGTQIGHYVYLSISDTGMGMSAETLARIFEPFFTTKEPGKGTGLGLAMVYGIVKRHNGTITVESRPGRGSTFTIYFPICDKPEILLTDTTPIVAEGGKETILVIDDEEHIRELFNDILSSHGYRVHIACDGPQAIELLHTKVQQVDLIITDMIMPNMSVQEIVARLRRLTPQARILVSSGFGDYSVIEQMIADGQVGFLQKPFSVEDLLLAVRKMLDRPPTL